MWGPGLWHSLGLWGWASLWGNCGGFLGGSWLARESRGEGGGGMAAMRHGCGEELAGTSLTGSVPAPPVPGGSGGPAAGTWPD